MTKLLPWLVWILAILTVALIWPIAIFAALSGFIARTVLLVLNLFFTQPAPIPLILEGLELAALIFVYLNLRKPH